MFQDMEPQLLEQDVAESMFMGEQEAEPDPEEQNAALRQAILQNQAEINARSEEAQQEIQQQNRKRTKFYSR